MLGPLGTFFVWTLGLALALTLTLLSLGLSAGEWRAAGRFGAGLARFSLRWGRKAAALLGHMGIGFGPITALGRLFGWPSAGGEDADETPAPSTIVRRELARPDVATPSGPAPR